VTIALIVARMQKDGFTLDQLRPSTGLEFDVFYEILRRPLGTGQIFV
jgi:lambda repressor-like predicted transcriptional regulator